VRVLDNADRVGGNIRTDRESGYVLEWGPNGFLDNVPATPELVRRVGLVDRMVKADEQSALRYIVRKGRPRLVPASPPAFLRSDALSWPGKLRIAGEPFAKPRPDGDETVHDFAARRIGDEAARVLVGAMVTGVYAGDARKLSLEATFPKMAAMEREYGGLFRAMLGKRREAKAKGGKAGGPAGPGGVLTSFRSGLQELTDGVAARLDGAIELSAGIDRIVRGAGRGYEIHRTGGRVERADAVVLACPAWSTAGLVRDLDGELAAELARIPSAPVVVAHLGFEVAELPERPRGFGFLVPRGEGATVLGALYTSNIFPGRSPEGKFLFTVMLGGAHEPERIDDSDDAIVVRALGDLHTTLDVHARPEFVRIFRHPRGIPQYTVGHLDRVRAIERALERLPGLAVSGNSYLGISVNHCAEEAPKVAERVLAAVRGA